MTALAPQASAQTATPAPPSVMSESGPVRLRQAPAGGTVEVIREAEPRLPAAPYVPGEFERFVQRMAGAEVRRLGSELIDAGYDSGATDVGASVPPDYVVAPGDELQLLIWGSVDADLRMVVDRQGRVTIPRVGTVQVAGVRHADLAGVIERRVAQVFRNFQLSVSLGQLRGVRIFVTGHAVRPGAYTVSALSTVVGALLKAGGPSAAGSFRTIEQRRGGTVVARFDLYDLLLRGDRSMDRLLQAGDVVHVGVVGVQVAVIGSVNRPAVVELTPNEGVSDALAMAGGFSAVAERSRLAIERLQDRPNQRVKELFLPADGAQRLDHGDVIRAFSSTESVLSIQRQNKRIRVDGEVLRPGEYVLGPNSTLRDAVQAAGGLTSAAYVFGTRFTRESVRATQLENYERALRDLETEFARVANSQRIVSGESADSAQAKAAANSRLIERLRALQPSGRVVLQLPIQATELPDLALEDGDRLSIPARPSTVGVFGSVFNTGSYLFGEDRSLGDYLRLAGGPTKGADESSIFVVRANGQVISGRQAGDESWFRTGSRLAAVKAEPGDTVFVPEEMDKSTFLQSAKDWTQILYQFGIGLAGIKSAVN